MQNSHPQLNLQATQLVAFLSVLKRDSVREWQTTIIAPLVTLILYLVVFGPVIGPEVGIMGGVSYIDYIFPGIVMFAIVLNAYNSSALSLYIDKFLRAHEEWLTASVADMTVMFALIFGGAIRSLILVAILAAISLFIGLAPQAQSPLLALAAITLTAMLFSSAGIINALFAKTFDQISIVPNMVLLPLSFTGGVFYDIALLSPVMQVLSLFNPIFYMVDALRAAMDGNNFLPYWLDMLVIVLMLSFVVSLCFIMFKRGSGLKQ